MYRLWRDVEGESCYNFIFQVGIVLNDVVWKTAM